MGASLQLTLIPVSEEFKELEASVRASVSAHWKDRIAELKGSHSNEFDEFLAPLQLEGEQTAMEALAARVAAIAPQLPAEFANLSLTNDDEYHVVPTNTFPYWECVWLSPTSVIVDSSTGHSARVNLYFKCPECNA